MHLYLIQCPQSQHEFSNIHSSFMQLINILFSSNNTPCDLLYPIFLSAKWWSIIFPGTRFDACPNTTLSFASNSTISFNTQNPLSIVHPFPVHLIGYIILHISSGVFPRSLYFFAGAPAGVSFPLSLYQLNSTYHVWLVQHNQQS